MALFARAETLAGDSLPLSLALLDSSIWMSHAMTILQTLTIPSAFYFKPVMLIVAVSWLFYRAYQVMNKPMQELANLLGFDIPPTPIIDLASIKADGAIIHWSLPEKQTHRSTLKFEIHLNGSVIDTLPIKESAATITGLQPGCFYVVRVALVNNVEFSSKSEPIRFRTKPASSSDFYVATADGHDTDHEAAHEAMPRIRPYRGLKDISLASPDAEPMVREASSGLGPRRSLNGGGRRSSGLGIDRHEPAPEVVEPTAEGSETIQRLTERLDMIRKETEEAERQAKEEDEEELQQKEELAKERDELKAEATEKERASRNLKREVNTMERQNTAAQNERSKHERLLEKKKQDHQKLKDDVVRWIREAEEMKVDMDRIQHEKEDHMKQSEAEKQKLKKRQAEEAALVKTLDDVVKNQGTEIKKLERAMKNSSPDNAEPETNIVTQMQQDAEHNRQWGIQYSQLQQEYAITFQKLEVAKRFYSEQQAYLETLRAKRRQEEASTSFVPPQERPLRRGDSQRSRTAQSGHSSTDSPRLTTFPLNTSSFGPSINTNSSIFPGAPFLNIHNGMSLSNPTDDIDMTDEERERLTGGVLMSPGAGANLLPSDLFGDGDSRPEITAPLPGLGTLPGMPGLPESMRHVLAEHPGPGPASPVSASSRTPSIFASPQASQQNLHIGSPEHIIDSDRRSVRSTRSNRATSGSGAGSRFGGMFGIKQRTKTVSDADDGLALGKALSHSMPRQDQGIAGIDSSSRKRNSSISGTVFSNLGNDGTFDAPQQVAATRRSRAFNIFGSRDKGDGWPSFGRRPASPRPGSTHSNNELPRPSFDSSRWGVDAWPSNDSSAGARSSPLGFGTGWNAQQSGQSRMYGSRLPSRRPSQQYGNSGPPEDIMEDEDSDALSSHRARTLGAIGTKPPSSSSGLKKAVKEAAVEEDVPKLNPNAKDFKSFLSSMRLKSKNPESSAPSTIASASSTAHIDKGEFDELSPPQSRRSKDTRDTRSMTTTSSIAESGRNSFTDLQRTTSYTPSELAPSAPTTPMLGSSTGKESFMQKLTRKSSSGGKFALPTFKRERSRLDVGKTTSSPVMQAEENELEDPPPSAGLRERMSRDGGSGRGWGSVLKLGMGKKTGGETPSVSGLSVASATGTEEGDDPHEEDGKVAVGLGL